VSITNPDVWIDFTIAGRTNQIAVSHEAVESFLAFRHAVLKRLGIWVRHACEQAPAKHESESQWADAVAAACAPCESEEAADAR